jgi:hypothetical protein
MKKRYLKYSYILAFFIFLSSKIYSQKAGINLATGSTPNTTLDVNGSVAFRGGTAISLANGVNNDVILGDYSLFRITGPTAAFSITGFTNGANGRVLTIINATSQNMSLANQTTSNPINQIQTTGSDVTLAANGVVTLIYNSVSNKWVLANVYGVSTPFYYEATQTSTLSQSFASSFANITGLGSLSVTIPRTGLYTITALAYFASGNYIISSANSGAQGSFRLVVDGSNYNESYLASVGIYDNDNSFHFYGLGTQGTIIKMLYLTAGTHTISVQGRTWAGTNCSQGIWGVPTSGYWNSGGADVGKCTLNIVENR